ncbi:hypothetical protein JOQ06_017342, partial [Pogonophryne albipinna]
MALVRAPVVWVVLSWAYAPLQTWHPSWLPPPQDLSTSRLQEVSSVSLSDRSLSASNGLTFLLPADSALSVNFRSSFLPLKPRGQQPSTPERRCLVVAECRVDCWSGCQTAYTRPNVQLFTGSMPRGVLGVCSAGSEAASWAFWKSQTDGHKQSLKGPVTGVGGSDGGSAKERNDPMDIFLPSSIFSEESLHKKGFVTVPNLSPVSCKQVKCTAQRLLPPLLAALTQPSKCRVAIAICYIAYLSVSVPRNNRGLSLPPAFISG